jgi:hypothetical protein
VSPVKPSAQPTQVRTLHLPPPAEMAPGLRLSRLAGRLLVVPPCGIRWRRGVPCRWPNGRDGAAVRDLRSAEDAAGNGQRAAVDEAWVIMRAGELLADGDWRYAREIVQDALDAFSVARQIRALRDGQFWREALAVVRALRAGPGEDPQCGLKPGISTAPVSAPRMRWTASDRDWAFPARPAWRGGGAGYAREALQRGCAGRPGRGRR